MCTDIVAAGDNGLLQCLLTGLRRVFIKRSGRRGRGDEMATKMTVTMLYFEIQTEFKPNVSVYYILRS